MNIQAMKILYLNTLNKEFRNKTIYSLFALTILVIFIIQGIFNFLQNHTLDAAGKLVFGADTKMAVFFIVISIWNTLLSGIMGVSCIKSDIDHKVIHQLLSFPIKRREYLIARILGTWTIVIGYYLISIITGSILFSVLSKSFVFNFNLFPALVASALSMLAILSWSLLLSQYLSKIIALLITLFGTTFITLANKSFAFQEFPQMFHNMGIFRFFGFLLHYLCPRTGLLNSMALDFVQGKEQEHSLLIQYGHFIISYIVLFYLINFLFKRKNF